MRNTERFGDKLHKLFPRLVNVGEDGQRPPDHRCPDGNALPDKLGSMLGSLA
jgi:hypothetical protein